MKGWIKEKLKIKVKVKGNKISNRVIIVQLENKEVKKEVMKNKNRLKGEKIFIEHDLTLEERRQEEITRWVKRKKKGKNYKVGYGKIKIRR